MTEEFIKRLVRSLFSGALFGVGIAVIIVVSAVGSVDDPDLVGGALYFAAISSVLAGLFGAAFVAVTAIWHAAMWAWGDGE